MSTISYANVVATGSTTPTSQTDATEVTADSITQSLAEVTTQETSSEQTSDENALPSPTPSPKAEKAKKEIQLAPAPVPEVSAWGSTPSSRSNSNVAVDTKFWPSPLEIPQQQPNGPSNTSKKIVVSKSSKEKWVPFKASVVLAQPTSNKKNNGQKRNGQKSNSNVNSANNNKSNENKARKTKSDKRSQQQPKDNHSSQQHNHQQHHNQHHNQSQAQQSQAQVTKQQPKDESQSADQEATAQQTNAASKEETKQEQTSNQQNGHHNHPEHHQNQHRQHIKHNFNPLQQSFNPQFHPSQQINQFYNPAHQYQRPPRTFNNNSRRYNKFNQSNGYVRNGHPNHATAHYQHRRSFTENPYAYKQVDPLFPLIKQVQYYFSVDNLVKDIHLRKQMNDEGWLPLYIIANFYRMNTLSAGDVSLIRRSIDELNGSVLEIAEFEGDVLKIRAKDNWSNWVLPSAQRDAPGNEASKLVKIIVRQVKEAKSTETETEGEAEAKSTETEAESKESEEPVSTEKKEEAATEEEAAN